MSTSAASHKVIIDTDPGIDDAMAIFLACIHPEIEVVGMTGVFGNVTSEQAARNALVLAELARQPHIPVARGLDVPRVIEPNGASHYVHGPEGFGDLPARSHSGKLLEETAAEFIVRMINAHPNEITLCPIGPLTNM